MRPLTAATVANASARYEYEAEDQTTSGIVIGYDRTFGTIAAEASGRRAVRLSTPGQSIGIRLLGPANALTIRYSLPRALDGRRLPATVLVRGNHRTVATAVLRSRYAYDVAPRRERQSRRAAAHHFWEETRILLPGSLAAGAELSVSLASSSVASAVGIDLIESEEVRPAAPPRGALSLLAFGADPSGRKNCTRAFARAISAARRARRALYVPQGRYRVDGHIIVDNVTIAGAGSWYSVIAGHHLGFYAATQGSSRVSISGLAVESDVAERQDALPLAAIGGSFSRSNFQNLYLHHTKVGIWIDGPAHDLNVKHVEIADQAADGINLHRGIRNAVLEGNRIRNTGDDGIASWSDTIANAHIVIRGNRIAAPGLANGIAIYGGRDLQVANNDISDVLVEGGGIHLGSRFRAAPFGGTISIENNRISRSGTMDPNWHFGIGAIWLYALEQPIKADIRLLNNLVGDPGCEAVQLIGPKRIDGVSVDGLRITGLTASVFALQTDGSLTAERIVVDERSNHPDVQVPPGFHLVLGAGNQGWTARAVEEAPLPRCL